MLHVPCFATTVCYSSLEVEEEIMNLDSIVGASLTFSQ